MVMYRHNFLRVWVITVVLAIISLVFLWEVMAQAQTIPMSYYYTNPLYYSGYGYFNSIDGYTIAPFTLFLTLSVSSDFPTNLIIDELAATSEDDLSFTMQMETEFSFKLPHGYKDEEGNIYSEGVMRLATAYDEIVPMKDSRVQSNPAYLIILNPDWGTLIGDLENVNPRVIEGLFSSVFIENLTNRPVLLRLNSGNTLHLAPCAHSREISDIEVDYGDQ
jgi:hypothetical protein